jgi:methylisocitrate lyase
MGKSKIFELIKKEGILVLPAVYDALTAKIAERAGFPAILMGGYSVSAVRLGQPDVGYLTMTEMAAQVKIIAEAVSVPLIADGDTGYGNPLNVMRTVEEYQKAGAAGIILEDQQFPKRCGHMEGKQVIPMEEHLKKLEAAIEARGNRDTLIIARTDSLTPLGLQEAIRRGKAYRDAGADVVFVEAPQTVDELKAIREAIPDVPLVANIIEGGKTPVLSAQELKEMGYEIYFCGLTAVLVTAKAIMNTMKHLRQEGSTAGLMDQMFSFAEFNELIGLKEFSLLEKKFKD